MIKGKYVKWTDAKLENLKKEYLSGVEVKDIATKYGCSVGAVNQQITLNGYSRKRNQTINMGKPMTNGNEFVTKSKQYVTKSGLDVTIYSDTGAAPYEIHGAIMAPKGAVPCVWNKSGKTDFPTGEYDLVEVRQVHVKDMWINVYKTDDGGIHYGLGNLSREAADAAARFTDRIACVKVTLNFMEGDGL